MRKLLTGLMTAGLFALAGTAVQTTDVKAADSKTIAVSIPAADHGWTGGVVYHAQQEAKALEARYPGLKVIVKTSPDGAAQANALEDLTTQGINALVVLPHNSDELTDPIRQVKGKGVFITVVDRALRDPIQDLYVAGNNPGLGTVSAAYVKEKLGGKGDVVVIRGLPIVIDEQRVNAFNEGLKGSEVKVIDSQFGNWSRDDAFKVMQDFLEAIKQAGRSDIKFVLGGAGMKDMIKKVMDGDATIPADVLYPPAMVAVAMDLTAAGLYDKLPVRGSYILDATLVTKDNAKDFYYPDSPF
jgi:ribose transport system substrate-binding protein